MVGMMELKRCDKAPMGLECINKLDHKGKCTCIKTEAFNAALQDAEDSFLLGGFKVAPNPLMPKDLIGVVGGNGDFDPAALFSGARRTGKQTLTQHMLDYLRHQSDEVDAQLAKDYAIYGCSYHTVDEQGRKVRIDPTKLVIQCRGITAEMVNAAKAEPVSPWVRDMDYRPEELGDPKSEPPCQHDWIFVERLNKMCCTQCEATRSAV